MQLIIYFRNFANAPENLLLPRIESWLSCQARSIFAISSEVSQPIRWLVSSIGLCGNVQKVVKIISGVEVFPSANGFVPYVRCLELSAQNTIKNE
jgi:hypothetical protein